MRGSRPDGTLARTGDPLRAHAHDTPGHPTLGP